MGDIVNLRMHRKRKKRADDAKRADENRVRFGLPASERRSAAREEDAEQRKWQAHQRDAPDDASS